MLLKMSKIALFPLILFACLAGIAHAADITTHVFGAKKQALDPAGNTMPAGYYVLKNLSDVDTDLVPGNIAVSTTIFGVLGTYTSDGTAATGDIAIGKIAYANGVKLTGSVPAGANVTGVAGSSVVTITDGLYSGNKTATVNDTLLSAGNIKTGVTIFATAGTFTNDANAGEGDILNPKTAYVSGVKLTGSMLTQTLSAGSNAVAAGYYAATTLPAVDTDLAAGNIAVSTTIFGVLGTYTSDGTAAAGDILSGKIAYVNGAKLTGSVPAGTSKTGGNGVLAVPIPNGLYSGGDKTAAANDTNLAAGNIKSGVTIFATLGTYTNPPPTPAVGGAWLLVPGNSSLGTRDFYVMKYDAKNDGSDNATSVATGFPWVSITQTLAKTKCTALGPGYHLLTMEEAQTISRNIENNGWNWTGGSVGSGGLWRGHSNNTPGSSLAADTTDPPGGDPYLGTLCSGVECVSPSIEKRVHQLSNGGYIWDWSGNVWQWLDMTCSGGTGVGLWSTSSSWLEWNDVTLSDYEEGRAGPTLADYTGDPSAQNAGQYIGCTADGKAVFRGGFWADGALAGVFAFSAGTAPSYSTAGVGFRCGR